VTDAQIALYAALRVTVPEPWRISGHATELTQVVYFERPVYSEPNPYARYFRTVAPQIVAYEKLAVATDRTSLEGPRCAEVIQDTVWQTRDLLAAAE
jgi:hypothetical protein